MYMKVAMDNLLNFPYSEDSLYNSIVIKLAVLRVVNQFGFL